MSELIFLLVDQGVKYWIDTEKNIEMHYLARHVAAMFYWAVKPLEEVAGSGTNTLFLFCYSNNSFRQRLFWMNSLRHYL